MIKDIAIDLHLLPFLQSLTHPHPSSNVSTAGPEDIYGGNLKLILGLIWTLIRRYQIKSSGRGISTKKAMLAWINTVIPEYGIENFNTDWNDGRALCGTVDRIRPGACPNHFVLDRKNGLKNCRHGMSLAEQHLQIPMVLSPEDLNNPEVDDLSVMTYISYFFDPANQQLLQWIRKKIPDRNIQNLSTDWNDGINLGALVESCFPGQCPEWQAMEPQNALQNLQKLVKLIKDRLGLECPVSAAELADPNVDELVVATYLSQFRNAKLRASPEEFSIRVPSLPNGSAIIREPVKFEVEVSQQAAELAGEIKVMAHGPSSDIPVNLVPKKGSNHLQATFVPTEAGSYEIFASYNGQHIQGSPFSLPVADPSKCQIFGDLPSKLQVGHPEEFMVKTRGAGIGKLTCTFDDTDQPSTPLISGEVTEKENDTFEVKLDPKTIGETVVQLKWAGEFVSQSPFRVSICDASKCVVTGDGLTSGKGRVGDPVTFTLTTKDAGTSKPDIKPRGPSAIYSPEIKDNGDDTYDVSFTPWEVGPHKVDVMWGGGHVPKSPFSMNIVPAPDANTCSATGKGLKRAIAGQETSFTILAPEKGLLDTKDGLQVQVSSLQDNAPVEISDNDDGSYKVSYTAPVPGAYVIMVKFYEKNIPGSPFKLEVVPAPNAAKCRAYGPALHPNSLHIAGTPLDLYVDTKEAGTGELQVVIKGPEDRKAKVYTANDKGVYSLKFDVPDPGRYHAHIWWSQVHIPGSPFKIRVHPGPNAGMVKAYGPGLQSSFEIDEPGEFTVETKNAGIGTLTIRVHGVKGAFKIEANPVSESDPRTLKGHYNPKEPGDYIIAIRWSGMHVPGSPFNVTIRPKPKPKKEKVKEEDITEDVDLPVTQIQGGVPVMTKEQMKKYQLHLLQQQRLAAAGLRQQPYMMNPAMMHGSSVSMQHKMQTNSTKTRGVRKDAQNWSMKDPTAEVTKKTSQVRIKEEAESLVYVQPEQVAKKKKKRKF